jgi:hypothetical protein
VLVTSEDLFAKFEGNRPANLDVIEQCHADAERRLSKAIFEFRDEDSVSTDRSRSGSITDGSI